LLLTKYIISARYLKLKQLHAELKRKWKRHKKVCAMTENTDLEKVELVDGSGVYIRKIELDSILARK